MNNELINEIISLKEVINAHNSTVESLRKEVADLKDEVKILTEVNNDLRENIFQLNNNLE